MTQLPKGSPQFICSSGKRSFLHVHVCFIYHAAMQKSRKCPSSTNPAQNEAQVSFSDQNLSVVFVIFRGSLNSCIFKDRIKDGIGRCTSSRLL